MKRYKTKIGAYHRSLHTLDVKDPERAARGGRRWLWRRFLSWPPLDFVVPDNLILLTCYDKEFIKNYDNEAKSLFEWQMEKHSVDPSGYKVLKLDGKRTEPWGHLSRWKEVVKYLKSVRNTNKEYVLFCDATDVIFSDSPSNILDTFMWYFDCDILYNATTYKQGYRWDKMAHEAMTFHNYKIRKFRTNRHLNGGLFIGKIDYAIELYERVLSYEFDSNGKRDMREHLTHPEFPFGSAHDQQILRHIEHEFYPRLQIDGRQKLFVRC